MYRSSSVPWEMISATVDTITETVAPTHTRNSHHNPDWKVYFSHDEVGRVVEAAIGPICLTILGICLGMRFRYHFMGLNLVRVLSLAVCWTNVIFIYAIGITTTITEMHGTAACLATVDVCLAFYAWTKVAAYTVFVARARPFTAKPFNKDYKFLLAIGFILIAYGVTFGIAFFSPKASVLGEAKEHCKIGLPRLLSIGLLSLDIAISIIVCLASFLHLNHHLRNRAQFPQRLAGYPSVRAIRAAIPFVKPDERYYTPMAQPEYHAAKTLVASLFLMLGTIANLSVMIVYNGYEEPWLCISACTGNSTAACMAVHYVTSKGPYAKVLGRVDSATLEMAPVSPG